MLVNVQVYPEGTHFLIPWFKWPVIYDIRARPHLVESTSGSRDLQMVNNTCCQDLLVTEKWFWYQIRRTLKKNSDLNHSVFLEMKLI